MKLYIQAILMCLFFTSCSTAILPFEVVKTRAVKDTIEIKPYEVLIGFKGSNIRRISCNPSNKLDHMTLSIKGYEDSSEIPLRVLQDSLEISLSDSSVKKIVGGTVTFQNPTLSHYHRFTDFNTNSKLSIAWMFKGLKPFRHKYVVNFACIEIKKADSTYTIPVRSYFIKWQ